MIGEVHSAHLYKPPTELRRKNRIKTIQSSLEIEGNTMTIDQVTAIINNNRVIAPQKDILEVKNAIEIYDNLDNFDANDIESLLIAHGVLMNGLIENAGRFRTSSVGIIKGEHVTHIAPAGDMVYGLMADLFEYLKNGEDLLLIKSCVFHYEFEFIHPFSDGNGRMGRLWQTLILKKYSPVFEFLPIESFIKENQQEYYKVLSKADNQGESTVFIEFMLEIIQAALRNILYTRNVILTQDDRIMFFEEIIGAKYFTRQDYLRNYKSISAATASRDLKTAVFNKIIKKTGDKRTSKYRYF